jgi:hypothetical protein
MKLQSDLSKIYSIFVLIFFTLNLFSQETKTVLNQDPKFEKLLNEKRKINSSLIADDRFRIQIFNGDNENAKKTLQNFKKEFKLFDATILFNTPTYKVVVGNYKTRIEAERNLVDVRKIYKNALLIRPRS